MKRETGPLSDDRIAGSKYPRGSVTPTHARFMVSSLDTLASVATPATLANIASLARQAARFG